VEYHQFPKISAYKFDSTPPDTTYFNECLKGLTLRRGAYFG